LIVKVSVICNKSMLIRIALLQSIQASKNIGEKMKFLYILVKLSVASNVASGYFSLISLDEKIAIMRRIIAIEKEVVRLNQSLTKNGIGNDMTLNTAVANLANTKAQLPLLEQQLKEQEVALSILLGRSPRAIVKDAVKRGEMITALPNPPSVPKILPSKLLTQRPDIRSAERELIVANANIDLAKAAYFPSLSLIPIHYQADKNYGIMRL